MSPKTWLQNWFETQEGRERHYLTRFSIGATLFFAGAGLMLFADGRITPSVTQELVALLGLMSAVFGALTSASAYIILTLLRLFREPNDK